MKEKQKGEGEIRKKEGKDGEKICKKEEEEENRKEGWREEV